MGQIKLIWDFNGVDSLKTAQHFNIHLEEFLEKEEIPRIPIGFKQKS